VARTRSPSSTSSNRTAGDSAPFKKSIQTGLVAPGKSVCRLPEKCTAL
jgi:hypothetical protein